MPAEEAASSGTTDETRTEHFDVEGDRLVAKLKEIIREGNVNRVIIKNDQGETLLEVPLTVGVVGALVAPVWAAIGAVAALVTSCTITIERREPARAEDGRSAAADATQEGSA